MNDPLDLKRFVQRKFRFTRASPPSITLRTMASRPFGVRRRILMGVHSVLPLESEALATSASPVREWTIS
jgi:hypothetical protein